MPKAIWGKHGARESDRTIEVEGNQYFRPTPSRREFFHASDQHTTCPWKGLASYYNVEVSGKRNPNAAWYYPEPKPAAKQIKDLRRVLEGREGGEVGGRELPDSKLAGAMSTRPSSSEDSIAPRSRTPRSVRAALEPRSRLYRDR